MIKGCSAFRVGEASLLLLEHQLAGQASDLTHVWRPAGALSIWSRGRHLPALPLLYSTVGAILTHSAAQEFQQEFYMHLVPWSLRLMPRGALVSRGLAIPGFQGTGTRGETVLGRLPRPSSDRGLKDTAVLLLWRTVCLSRSFGLRGKL